MSNSSRRIAQGYTGRYHSFPMKRALGLFVYHPYKTCPLCGSDHVHRTKRGRILEFWVLLFLPVRPYRCGKCRLRFYAPKKFAPVGDPEGADDLLNEETSTTAGHSGSSRR
jgi:hypothetical protein